MAQWSRTTPWRQGCILSDGDLRAICGDVGDPEAIGVVVSHSCDLAQLPETEPHVEIIVGKIVAAANGSYLHARNARTLHLPANADARGIFHLEMKATNKILLDKIRMAETNCEPDRARTIGPREQEILQRWLAARYRRSTFPDEFDRRLGDKVSGVHGKLAKMHGPIGRDIEALFFDIDEGQEVERDGEKDVYLLAITVLYSTAQNSNAADVAEALKKQIGELFKAKFFDANKKTWKWIELDLVACISTEELSYEAAKRLKKWNADYVSLRAAEDQQIFE